ncbi:MAG TPA: ABC transporter permease, partial [Bryobacteraceae bacterium]|nr:ABC transporter permease [Bryobacteraceae bacterium]
LGRKIPLNGEPYEVIGVMPREYRYPSAEYEVWTPLYIPAAEIKHGQNHQYITVARLKPGVTIEQARSEMQGVMARLIEANRGVYGSVGQEIGALIEPLAESDAVQVKSMLFALLAAAGCVLLIGCMNLGILLLARASARARELTVRVALGASGGQLRLQMLAEVVPLGLAGAAGGLLFSSWILQALLPLLPTDTPRVDQVGLHSPVLAFAVVVSFAVVLLAGLLPAWISARTNLAGTLQQNSRGVSSAGTARNWLVVAQVAVTVVLLFGASLFARSFRALSQVNPGFSTEGTLTMHMAVTRAKYRTDKQVSDYYDRLVARIESVPGVTRAGIVNRLPLSGTTQTGGIEFEGKEGKFDADWRSATPGYFEAIGIPIRRGRLFSGSDRPETPGVGLIDEHLARQVFGTEDPLGKRFRIAIPGVPWTQIVGVVGHIRHESPEKDVRPQVYWPESQRPQERAALVVKTSGPPESFTRAVIDQIHQEEPAQPVYDVRAMNQWLERSLKPRTLMTSLVGLFAGASLLLACLGLYGVVSYTAGLRLREFGIRIALGANSRQVGGLVLRHAGKLALWGSIAGLALAWPVGRAIQTLLFGVSVGDAASWIAAPAVLIVVGVLAALGPARRASGTDPAITLRAE